MNVCDRETTEQAIPPVLSPNQWITALFNKKVCIRTFGCAYNVGDSDLLAWILERHGSVIVPDPQDADAIILNTCIVIGSTERKMHKEMQRYPGREIYVTGCLPLGLPDRLGNQPLVKVILPDSIHEAAHHCVPSFHGPVQVVQVGPGCVGSCRYCITRRARGRIRSIPQDKILSRIMAGVHSGAIELRLAGQDLSCYGHDLGTCSLCSLLQQIPPLPAPSTIRLGMMNPATLLPIAQEVAYVMKTGSFFSFLHLPIQSGSDAVLTRMNRGYTSADIMQILDIFRSEIPDITIATDIICGFPGETEDDHKHSLDLLMKMDPGMVNVTRYSWRPGTGMSREEELPDRIRKDRSRDIIKQVYPYLLESNKKKIGLNMEVVTTEQIKPGSVMARSKRYEGVVIHGDYPPGISFQVTIIGCTPHYLIGDPVRD